MKRQKSRRSSSWKRISRMKGLTMKQKARMYKGKRSRRSNPKRRRRRKGRNHPLHVKFRRKLYTKKQLARKIGKGKARKYFAKRKSVYHGKTRLRKANRSHRRGRRSKRRNFR